MKNNKLWLRDEVKEGEKRTAITPENAAILVKKGFEIIVEKSSNRCFPDEDYLQAGCKLVESGTWKSAPKDYIILGLKELPENDELLSHQHCYFAHCYKGQAGAHELLTRFKKGNGLLWDLEFLNDDSGRRVAAFGASAGFVGMGLAIKQWCLRQENPKSVMASVPYYADSNEFVAEIKRDLEKIGKIPKIIIIGALGRCGKGAADLAVRSGIPVSALTLWDLQETQKGGPFEEILQHDIFVNCIYLSSPIPPFINSDLISIPGRKLSVICDVSCDTSNPHNPIPLYKNGTTLFNPIFQTDYKETLDIIAIDHLPSVIPSESSKEFSNALLPHLSVIGDSPVWRRAEELYFKKLEQVLNPTSI